MRAAGPTEPRCLFPAPDGSEGCQRVFGHDGDHARQARVGVSLLVWPAVPPLSFADFAREHLEDRGDVFEVGAENGMGC